MGDGNERRWRSRAGFLKGVTEEFIIYLFFLLIIFLFIFDFQN